MAKPGKGRARRPALPPKQSVVAQATLAPARPARPAAGLAGAGPTYQILRTTQVDPYDTPVPRAAVPAIGAAAIPGDNFQGTARKAAKLSISSAKTEPFADVQALIKTLPSKTAMKNHSPKITTAATSARVAEEKRNVRVTAFLYAASREDDNDFHLILGRDPGAAPVYMTAEVSGLPPKSSSAFAKLNAARNAFKKFFGAKLPGTTYDFYQPPIPVEVEGSLFFDMSHASGQGPGPATLHKDIPTIWEIHPVSKIVFEP